MIRLDTRRAGCPLTVCCALSVSLCLSAAPHGALLASPNRVQLADQLAAPLNRDANCLHKLGARTPRANNDRCTSARRFVLAPQPPTGLQCASSLQPASFSSFSRPEFLHTAPPSSCFSPLVEPTKAPTPNGKARLSDGLPHRLAPEARPARRPSRRQARTWPRSTVCPPLASVTIMPLASEPDRRA